MDKNEKLFEVSEVVLQAVRAFGNNVRDDDGWINEDSAQILARTASEKILSVLEPVEDEVISIPFEGDDWIGKYYEMNPVEEDLLPSGHFLSQGMKVVPESSMNRIDIFGDIPLSAGDIFRARKQNRWFTVSHIVADDNGDIIHFVGTYEDGVKRKWSTDANFAWIYKLDSVPDDPHREYMERADTNPDAQWITLAPKKEFVQAAMWKQHLSED
jgi:hypothetical protein